MPDISTPNLDYNDMLDAWDLNDALMGGTFYIRQLGEIYMPRWINEEKEDYQRRLAISTLLPAYEETIKQNCGRVFADVVQLSEETPEKIVEYSKNFDMAGNRLDVWAQEFFSLGLQYGLVHALVDYPRIDKTTVRTRADEIASGARPYVTMLNPKQVIGWDSKPVNGRVVLTELRIREIVVVRGEDFGQKKIEQIRHILPGKVEIWRKGVSAGDLNAWLLHEEWETSRQDIPLVTF